MVALARTPAGGVARALGSAAVVAMPLAVGLVGAAWTAEAIPGWYRQLAKPSWIPPDAVFGPVWTALYVSMGIALLDVIRTRGRGSDGVGLAVVLFGLQLGLNLAWSWLFFARRNPEAALVEIALLHLAITATILAFGRIRPRAALLLLPYLAWVSFAAVLNAEVVRLNP
jgi:tryptophan-rich sensory protein